MNIDKELTIEQEVTKDCPILFQMRHRPMSETCMCWGFECGKGWHETIASTCRELEMLNSIYYPEYRVRIQADQIKEKFGTLHFYWSVVVDPNAFVTWLSKLCHYAYNWFNDHNRFDYCLKKVCDQEPYDYDDTRMISKEDYEKKINDKFKCSNVEYQEVNGEYKEIVHLHNYGKYHNEPTKHIFAWKLKNLYKTLECFFKSFPRNDNAKVRNCIEFMNRYATRIVQDAEVECSKHCEECGNQIGTDWSPTCQTTGWITYICDKCAAKKTGQYIKNGELWQGDKKVEKTVKDEQ